LNQSINTEFSFSSIQGVLSSWADIQKGIPQCSILGPLLFNILINDIFYLIEYGTLYNYADDNTLWHVSYCQLQWLETYLD
jgi:hypothetical protein